MPPRKKQKTSASTAKSTSFPTVDELKEAENQYERALELRAAQHTRGKAEDLVELDKWLNGKDGLLGKIAAGKDLNKEDLTSLMKWKLSRGKSRPTLLAMVASNSEELVRSATRAALGAAREADGDFETALKAIPFACTLKGVGAATASALLTLQPPSVLPFMSDEAASFFENSLGPVKYTDSYYAKFARAMDAEVQRLAKEDTEDWDARRLERALFSVCILATS